MKLRYLTLLIVPCLLSGCVAQEPIASTNQSQQATKESLPAARTLVAEKPSQASTAAPTLVAEQPSQPLPSAAPTVAPAKPTTKPATPTPVATVAPAQATTAVATTAPRVPIGSLTSQEAEKVISKTAQQTILALKHKDMQKLSRLVHPEKGLTFSPDGFPADVHVIFKADELPGRLSDPTVHTWGYYDGTGDPIDLTFAAYFDKFVYSHDFARADQVGYNELIGQADMRQGSLDLYGPDSIMVEYHFPGFDPKYEGMDWKSLRLVFQQADQTWYLVSIVYDQWGI